MAAGRRSRRAAHRTSGYGFNDATGTAASFSAPASVALSLDRRRLYVADGRYVRKIVLATSVVGTVMAASLRIAGRHAGFG